MTNVKFSIATILGDGIGPDVIKSAIQIINKAFSLHSKGNTLEAKKYYKLYIEKGFNDPIVFCNYGTLLRDDG